MAKAKKTKKKKSAKPLSVPAIQLRQHDALMYVFVLTSTHLLNLCTVSRREEDAEKGYQRHLKDSRLRQVAHYVDDDKGVIPNNIVINFYDPDVSFSKGRLRIPNRQCAWVIDGQHRLFGFTEAKSVYPLLVVAFIGLDLKKQVEIFSVINTEQKKLPTSLAIDLLKFIGDPLKDLETRSRELVAQLNEEPDSPWFQRINMTGEGVGPISLVNFVRKLKPLLDGGALAAYPFDLQYGALANYWQALAAVYSEQWNDRGSLLNKTLGFGALMNVFPFVFNTTMSTQSGSFSVAKIIDTFKLIKDVKFNSDTLGSGSGNKAEMAAALILQEELQQAIKANNPKQELLKLKD